MSTPAAAVGAEATVGSDAAAAAIEDPIGAARAEMDAAMGLAPQ
jgi:hypothetical protein